MQQYEDKKIIPQLTKQQIEKIKKVLTLDDQKMFSKQFIVSVFKENGINIQKNSASIEKIVHQHAQALGIDFVGNKVYKIDSQEINLASERNEKDQNEKRKRKTEELSRKKIKEQVQQQKQLMIDTIEQTIKTQDRPDLQTILDQILKLDLDLVLVRQRDKQQMNQEEKLNFMKRTVKKWTVQKNPKSDVLEFVPECFQNIQRIVQCIEDGVSQSMMKQLMQNSNVFQYFQKELDDEQIIQYCQKYIHLHYDKQNDKYLPKKGRQKKQKEDQIDQIYNYMLKDDADEQKEDVPDNEQKKDVPKDKKDVPKDKKDVPKDKKDVFKDKKDVPKNKKDVPKNKKDIPKNKKDVSKGLEIDVSKGLEIDDDDSDGFDITNIGQKIYQLDGNQNQIFYDDSSQEDQ